MSARCTGHRKGYNLKCNGSLWRCVCGNVGCKQNKDDICSNQGFTVFGKCLKCGETGKLELVAPEEVGYRRTLMGDPA
jgi:hypothetical protein